MMRATIFSGAPCSCAHVDHVRRKVVHVARRRPSAAHAGNTHRRSTLFGEIGLPERVANTSPSGSIVPTCAFQAAIMWRAPSASGMSRRLASVFGVPTTPSYRLPNTEDSVLLVQVPPPKGEQLATAHTGEQRHAYHRARQQWQRVQRPGSFVDGQRPLRAHGLELREAHAVCWIGRQMVPRHCRPQHGAQDIVDVIDGLRRIPRRGEFRDVRLHVTRRDRRERLAAEPRTQVFLDDVLVVFWVDHFYIGSTVFNH